MYIIVKFNEVEKVCANYLGNLPFLYHKVVFSLLKANYIGLSQARANSALRRLMGGTVFR